MTLTLNRTVLMSGADYFSDEFAINPHMDPEHLNPVDVEQAKTEHHQLRLAFQQAGIEVHQVAPPEACQDGVYTANWALCRGDIAVMSSLPNKRQAEEPYAVEALQKLGKKIVKVPEGLKFSGQGDALPCGKYLFAGYGYRTDKEVHSFLAATLDYEVISVHAVPAVDLTGQPITNSVTGWPDSFFYDIDLAISVLRPDLIAWCPEALTPESQEAVRAVPIEKIEVSFEEATKAFACNLVSTGETVIMSGAAPKFKAAVEAKGLKVLTPQISELAKGGGYIRCTSLTLDNI